jgi:hypothetical protein
MEFAYEITVNGAEEAKAALASIATAEDKRNKNMQQVLPAIKEVARDLDNLGLNVGKTFTMASEGALSVVAAIGSGGMAGAIGLATLAVGALAQAWVTYGNAHKRAEEEAQSRLDAFKTSMESVSDIIKEMQKPLTSGSLLEQEAEIMKRRIAQEHAGWDLILLQDELFRLKRAAAWAGPASALYEEAIKAQEKKIADFREHTADQTRITMGKIRKKQEDEEQLAFEAQAKRDAENAKKKEEERKRAAEKAAEEDRKMNGLWGENYLSLFASQSKATQEALTGFWGRVHAINDAGRRRELADEKRRWESLEAVSLDAVKADIAAAEKMTSDVEAVRSEGAMREQQRAMDRVNMSATERESIIRNMAAIEQERERFALDQQMRALDLVETTTEAEELMVQAQRVTLRQVYDERRKIREADTDHHIQKMKLQAHATDMATAANIVYGEASMLVAPMVSGLSSQVAKLGDLNRENAHQIRDFAEDLPAIIAKEAQAYAAGIAAQAVGKASMSLLDAGRETALGVGMLFIPGGQAAAAGHFKSAALHTGMAAGYAALAGGAAGAAIGIGAVRGEGGIVPLTREEQERQGRDRSGRGDGGSDGPAYRGNGGGGMGSSDDAFAVNITYMAGSIAPADENRAARSVASATRRARSNAFDRRRMGA